MNPLRPSLCTYNLWNTERWPDRRPALEDFLLRHQPDILCVQELREATRDCIDATLPGHTRVVDPLPGWTCESNIWWNQALFAATEYGADDIGILEPERRLFWVRLHRNDGGGTVFVATTHLTHQHAEPEIVTGQSPRIAQARAAMTVLTERVGTEEPAWLMGDFNDAMHVSYLLHREAGWTSCFADLNMQPPPTFPALPTAGWAVGGHVTNLCYDWILSHGPARALAACSPHVYVHDLAPSDHWPVVAVYEV